MYWKGKIQQPGTITDYPSHLVDVMPTILEVSGTHYPELYKEEPINPADGVSLLPLTGCVEPQRDEPIFWQWANGKAIRKGKWKLVSDHSGPWELYDMEVDQTETNDLIDDYPEVTEELKTEWKKWLEDSNIELE